MNLISVLFVLTEPIAFHNSYFGDGYGPIIYSNVSCGGWEQRVADCTKTTYPAFTCSREQTAGVLCGDRKWLFSLAECIFIDALYRLQ